MARLASGSLGTLSLALLLIQQPAFADGGAGSNSGAPGIDFAVAANASRSSSRAARFADQSSHAVRGNFSWRF
jgi:hypothetical protein